MYLVWYKYQHKENNNESVSKSTTPRVSKSYIGSHYSQFLFSFQPLQCESIYAFLIEEIYLLSVKGSWLFCSLDFLMSSYDEWMIRIQLKNKRGFLCRPQID